MTIRRDHHETTSNPADELAIRELFERLLEDRARGDGEAYGSRFTEDADYVAFDGSHTRGRAEISSSHQQLFDRFLKGTRLTGRIESTIMRGKTTPSPERHSVQTLIAVREGGEWRFATFHNTRVRPIGRGVGGFLIWAVTDRLWRTFGPGENDA